jgi:hypothetical protein
MLLALVIVVPIPTMAGVDIHVSIPLPPPIVFAAPPELIVIPETYAYVAPDIDVDLFFWNGWWWRLWEGRWYRSHYYNRGWGYYNNVPSFYFDVDPGWRGYYRDHRWGGHQWNYQRIPHQQLQRNWSSWEKSRHWEKQQTWGVQGLKPRAQSQIKPQSREAVKPQPQVKPQSREVQPQHSQPEVKPQSQPQHGKPERGEVEKQDRK